MAPQAFAIGTPLPGGPARVDWRSHRVRDIYEEKFATQKENMYDESDEKAWMSSTTADLIGRDPAMYNILTWVEGHGKDSVDKENITKLHDTLGLMTDPEPSAASSG